MVSRIYSYGQGNNSKQNGKSNIQVATDSIEYELVILDPGFESWLATQPKSSFTQKITMK